MKYSTYLAELDDKQKVLTSIGNSIGLLNKEGNIMQASLTNFSKEIIAAIKQLPESKRNAIPGGIPVLDEAVRPD